MFDRDCVLFYAVAGGSVHNCLISGEALMTHFGARDMTATECLRAYGEHRQAIQDVAERKILAGTRERGWEVLIMMEDFPRQTTTTTPPPPTRGLQITESSAVRSDPAVGSVAGVLNRQLRAVMGVGHSLVKADWDAIPVSGEKLIRLRLTDAQSGAVVQRLFTREDLESLSPDRLPLFRMWDDLLLERGRLQFQSLANPATVEG